MVRRLRRSTFTAGAGAEGVGRRTGSAGSGPLPEPTFEAYDFGWAGSRRLAPSSRPGSRGRCMGRAGRRVLLLLAGCTVLTVWWNTKQPPCGMSSSIEKRSNDRIRPTRRWPFTRKTSSIERSRRQRLSVVNCTGPLDLGAERWAPDRGAF